MFGVFQNDQPAIVENSEFWNQYIYPSFPEAVKYARKFLGVTFGGSDDGETGPIFKVGVPHVYFDESQTKIALTIKRMPEPAKETEKRHKDFQKKVFDFILSEVKATGKDKQGENIAKTVLTLVGETFEGIGSTFDGFLPNNTNFKAGWEHMGNEVKRFARGM